MFAAIRRARGVTGDVTDFAPDAVVSGALVAPAAWRFSPQSAAPHHRLIIWKMGTKNYKQKTTEGTRSANYYLVVGKCFAKNSNQNYGFLFFICLILTS